MHNILVTGSSGQLGNELQVLSSSYTKYNFIFANKEQLDISNKDQIKACIEKNKINTIINAAAYTAVDKAENETEQADAINNIAVAYLAELSNEFNLKLIHISSDYIFDGKNFRPYKEDDTVAPHSIYGETKLNGEQSLLKLNVKNSIIIRTSWVYSYFGVNFVKTMMRLGNERDTLGVIYDQVGTPTYAKDLAQAILEILPQINNDATGVYNYSNEGVTSWYDFAIEIMDMAKIDCKINPIETKDYPTPATRPHYSVLNKSKIRDTFNIEIPYWKDSLQECIKLLESKK